MSDKKSISQTSPAALHRCDSVLTSTSSHPSSVFSDRLSPANSELTTRTSLDEKRRPSLGESNLGDESKVSSGAYAYFENFQVELSKYEVESTSDWVRVLWNKGSHHQLRQQISVGANPTLTALQHRSLSKTSSQRLVLVEGDYIRYLNTDRFENALYSFPTATEAAKFQSTVSRRQLVAVKDFDSISTSVSFRHGEASRQVLHVWRNPSSGQYSLHYHANRLEKPLHREILITSFDRPGVFSKFKQSASLRLNLVKQKRTSDGESRPSPDVDSQLSHSTRKNPIGSPSSVPSPASQARTSARMRDETTSSSPSFSDEIARLKYLDIEFANDHDCDDFLGAFLDAYDRAVQAQAQAQEQARPANSVKLPATIRSDEKSSKPVQRATPMGLLGLSLTLEQLGLD